MDIPLLIREVHKRPPIWNQKSTHYYNRDVVSKSWEEVALACGMSYEAVKSKWKHLRDNFRKEFKKCLKDGGYQSDPEKYESGWVWFKSLNFLTDKLTSKRLTTESKADPESILSSRKSNSQTTTESFEPYPCFQADFENSNFVEHSDESRLYSGNDSSSSDTVPNVLDVKRVLPSIESKKRLLAGNGANMKKRKGGWKEDPADQGYDDTYHFLMSLLSPIKHLPYDRQMCVRLKMQEIISSEIMQLHGISQIPYPVELKAVDSDNSPPTITPNDPPSDEFPEDESLRKKFLKL